MSPYITVHMKKYFLLALAVFCLMGVSSCEEKKKSADIITKKPVVKVVPSGPKRMSGYERTETVDWNGGTYKITVKRRSADGIFTDDNGKKYYDNVFTLTILRPDGTEFVHRELTKQSYSGIVDDSYLSKSTALGLALLDVKDGKLVLLGSVGSPDELSDDFIPISITISRDGTVSMKQSDNNGDSMENEDGV